MWLASLASFQGRLPTSWQTLARASLAIACVEFFFRALLVFPLLPALGWYTLAIGAMPYCVLHVGAPLIELFGSIVFGIGLCYLSVRTRSVLYAIVLNWALQTGPLLVRGVPRS